MSRLSKRLSKKLSKRFELPWAWGMSNLGEETTGIDIIIFVFLKMHSSGPIIKVGKTGLSFRNKRTNFSVSVSDTPKVVSGSPNNIVDSNTLNKIFEWVILNKIILLRYWNGKLNTVDMINGIQKVSS